MTTKELLLAAADRLERDGWTKGALRDGSRCCIVGTLDATYIANLHGKGVDIDAFEDAYRLLQEATGYTALGEWNDQPGRTAEEVIAKLREVAEGL